MDNKTGWKTWSATVLLIAAAVALPAGGYLSKMRAAEVAPGFPLDDSWIHAQYARTLVEGRPFEYVPGQPSIGTTSVLYDVLWAGAVLVTGEYVRTAYALNFLLTVGAGLLLVVLLRHYRLPPLVAAAGAALILAGFPFPWSTLSGMETALATFLTTAALVAHVVWARQGGGRSIVAPILMALAAMARPENLILFPLAEVDRLLLYWRSRDKTSIKPSLGRFAMRAAVFLLALSPYLLLNYAVHGAPVPNTYQAKVGRLGLGAKLHAEGLAALPDRLQKAWEVPRDSIGFIADHDNLPLLPLAGVGVVFALIQWLRRREDRDTIFPLLVFLGTSAAVGLVTMGLFFPGQAQRYLVQWIPLLLVYGILGLHLIATFVAGLVPASRHIVYGIIILIGVGLSTGWIVGQYPEQRRYFVNSVSNINDMQVALGKWIDQNTPPDAIIATNDIGAIAFFGDRPIVDTIGLIDPEIVRRKNDPHDPTAAMLQYLKQRQVTHALLFPQWHPDLILDPHFRPIDRVVLGHNVICGDDRMLVMKVDWHPLPGTQPALPDWAEKELENCRSLLKLKLF